jgi:cytochrome c2
MEKMVRRFASVMLWAGLGTFTVFLTSSIVATSGQAQTTGKHGKELFEKRCGGCHAMDRDKEGPRLGGVYGRTAASVSTFEYSAALQKSKITWTEETLEKWLTDPDKLVPDNDMPFHVPSADERREIIAYLKQLAGK